MTTERDILENFLKETKLIRMKYEKLEEIQATHFNVFSILHKEHDEVKENEETNCHKKNNHQKHEIPVCKISENKDTRKAFIDDVLQEMREYIETLKKSDEFKNYDWQI